MMNTCSSMTGFSESSEIPEAYLVDDSLIGENPWQTFKITLMFIHGSLPRPTGNHSGASYLLEIGYNLQSSSGLIYLSDCLLVLWNQALVCYYGECVYEYGRWFPDYYMRAVLHGYVRSQGEQLQFAVVSCCSDLCGDADFYGFYATDATMVHLNLWFCVFSFDKQQAVATDGFWLLFTLLKDCFMTFLNRSELSFPVNVVLQCSVVSPHYALTAIHELLMLQRLPTVSLQRHKTVLQPPDSQPHELLIIIVDQLVIWYVKLQSRMKEETSSFSCWLASNARYVAQQGESIVLIVDWISQRHHLLLLHISPDRVSEGVRSLSTAEAKPVVVTVSGKYKVAATFFITYNMVILLLVDSIIGLKLVDGFRCLTTFIFGSLTRPPEAHFMPLSSCGCFSWRRFLEVTSTWCFSMLQ